MAYCLYVRKSRADAEAEARGEGETLARHIHTLRELASRRNLEVTVIHREIVSGETIAARPVMQQLLSEVESGLWEGVLVMEVERLARGDTIDQGIVAQTFKFSETKIITPLKDYDPNNEFDEEYFEFGLFMSRREYKTINRRLQRGRVASVKEGNYVAGTAPYGYDRIKLPDAKGYTLTPNPPQAEVVAMIFQLYTEGELQEDGTYRRLGPTLIAKKLNALHIPPKRSATWSNASIREILLNPVYIGKVRWNCRPSAKRITDGKMTIERPRSKQEDAIFADGKHPAIISEAVYQKAQDSFSIHPPQPINLRHVVKNPLGGLIICEKCGRKMVRRPYPNRPDMLICAYNTCDNVAASLASVEKHVLRALQNWLDKYRLNWETGQKEKTSVSDSMLQKEKVLRRLETEHNTLQKQSDQIHDLLEQGIYTVEAFQTRMEKIHARIKQNEADTLLLKTNLETERNRLSAKNSLIPKVEHLLDVYATLPSAKAKNELLKEVLEKVVYLKRYCGRWHGDPEDFTLTIYPRLPHLD